MAFQTSISGATGTVCSKSGLYKATDRKAQYIELITAGSAFPPFPGGKGTKGTTWYLISGTTTNTAAVSDTDGTVGVSDDGGFTSVIVPAGTE